MEFVDKLLAQSKFSSQDKKDFTIQLHKKVVADKHDMSTKERMGIVQDWFSSIIKSTIQNVPDSDEIDLFKKCVRKNTRARIRMMKYYNELMSPSLEQSAALNFNSLRDLQYFNIYIYN